MTMSKDTTGNAGSETDPYYPSSEAVEEYIASLRRSNHAGWRDLREDPPGGCINGRAILYWRPTDGEVRMETVSHAIDGYTRRGYTKWLDITLPATRAHPRSTL